MHNKTLWIKYTHIIPQPITAIVNNQNYCFLNYKSGNVQEKVCWSHYLKF